MLISMSVAIFRATQMVLAPILLVLLFAVVTRVTMAMVLSATTLMSVLGLHVLQRAVLAPIPTDHSAAHATSVSTETDLPVQI